MQSQEQFLSVVTAEEAHRIFREAVPHAPLGAETVPLDAALGRVLAEDVTAAIDVPAFDRSNVDGFAVRAQDTFGAEEQAPVFLRLTAEVIHTNVAPRVEVTAGAASAIATGGVIPRGADAVVMVEYTLPKDGGVLVTRAAAPGAMISFAGTDIGAGETVLHRRARLTSRETGVLAAIGRAQVRVYRRPRVAILSTGDEIIAPGAPMALGKIYDSNGTIIADAVRELGAEPVRLGIVPDDAKRLERVLREALDHDLVLLSGGTSKGAGDLNYQVVQKLGAPGILVHGVALKPGKPLCFALVGKTPIVILPGFPTSAVFTFHEYVAPMLRAMAGLGEEDPLRVPATVPMRVNSERGRTEFLLINLVRGSAGFSAYPMGKGSGSVTAFSNADGFIAIERNREIVEPGEPVQVTLIGQALRPADLIFIGSHCTGVDYLISRLCERGWRVKAIAVGSQGGLAAARREECDLAGMHLLDEQTGVYNAPFLDDTLRLVKGYGRRQGVLFRPGDARFEGRGAEAAVAAALADPACRLINRNRGSGTRILIDRLLKGARPPGFHVEARSHNAVAAAIHQGRAEWGVAIVNVAQPLGLGFLPLVDEEYDFAVPKTRLERPAVHAFLALLGEPEARRGLLELGMTVAGAP
ncbi:MAG: molybdopterin biosynthesis protein [Candidatus Lambdaproteobacteria bacterium]|nr:molybdopterin biosynthesis protein [Candidatus Lambdaproteobacteria bacterium]